jgi:hypothetical protein
MIGAGTTGFEKPPLLIYKLINNSINAIWE